MIDFHTHVLPGIDDGCKSGKESVALLKELKEQGVNNVFLTPHFYAYSSSAENYTEIREKSLENLIKNLKNAKVDINLYLGSEVYFFEELWRIEDISKLCIRGTEYILIEMPFSEWTDSMVHSFEKIIGKGITPVLAHFERYIKYGKNLSKIYELVDMGVFLQMNCSFVNKFSTRRKAIKFIRKGIVSMLGTDSHNLFDRAPDYLEASEHIKKKLTDRDYKNFIHRQKNIIATAEKVYPV